MNDDRSTQGSGSVVKTTDGVVHPFCEECNEKPALKAKPRDGKEYLHERLCVDCIKRFKEVFEKVQLPSGSGQEESIGNNNAPVSEELDKGFGHELVVEDKDLGNKVPESHEPALGIVDEGGDNMPEDDTIERNSAKSAEAVDSEEVRADDGKEEAEDFKEPGEDTELDILQEMEQQNREDSMVEKIIRGISLVLDKKIKDLFEHIAKHQEKSLSKRLLSYLVQFAISFASTTVIVMLCLYFLITTSQQLLPGFDIIFASDGQGGKSLEKVEAMVDDIVFRSVLKEYHKNNPNNLIPTLKQANACKKQEAKTNECMQTIILRESYETVSSVELDTLLLGIDGRYPDAIEAAYNLTDALTVSKSVIDSWKQKFSRSENLTEASRLLAIAYVNMQIEQIKRSKCNGDIAFLESANIKINCESYY